MANTIIINKGSGYFNIDNSIPDSVNGQDGTNGDYPLNSVRFIYLDRTVIIKNIYTDIDVVSELAYTSYINGKTGLNFVDADSFKAYVRQGFFTQPNGESSKLIAPVLTAEVTGINDVLLSLSTVPNAQHYIVQRATNRQFTVDIKEIYSGTETEYDDVGLITNTTYYYRAKAIALETDYEDSSWSKIITATPQPNYSQIYTVGIGSGDLTLDGNVDTYDDNSLILILPGTYGTITFQNINPATMITIKNGSGVVRMDGGDYEGGNENIYAGLNFNNCSNLLISGNGSNDEFGFYIHDNRYRTTEISGVNRNVTMQYFLYENIGDYSIHVTGNNTIWDGTDDSIDNYNLKFLRNRFNNCNGSSVLDGFVTTTAVYDLTKMIEFGYNEWINCDSGNLVFVGATDQIDIHDNIFSNINITNNNDNGCFMFTGNGNFYRNYANSYQGHVLRLWSLSFGTTPEDCLIYDNICIGSRKYSPFEWQSTVGENVKDAPNTTYVNIKLCNNTGGNLNYEQNTSFDACLIDNYGMPTGSTQEVYNNMLYNTFTSNGIAHRIYQFSDSTVESQAIADKNIYYADNVIAGFNEILLSLSSNSPAKDAGLSGHLIYPLDYHNKPFNASNPSIGGIS